VYVKIHSEKGTKNRGSAKYLVDYLSKENLERDPLEHELFFDQLREDVSGYTVQNKLDWNKAKLGKNEAKFYMISVNPSQPEQRFMLKQITGRDVKELSQLTATELKRFEGALKDYSRQVMDEYAKNFNRGLTGENLLYYGKVEHTRYYGKDSPEVREGLRRVGEQKEGLQAHVHLVVSRKDITNKIRLSPMANARGAQSNLNKSHYGFDRKQFVQTCEKSFDGRFRYDRAQHHTFEHRYAMKNTMRSVALATFKDVPLVREGAKASRAVRTVSAIAKAKDPLELLTAAFRQVPGASQCIRAISYVHNPAKLALDIGKKILQTGLNSGL